MLRRSLRRGTQILASVLACGLAVTSADAPGDSTGDAEGVVSDQAAVVEKPRSRTTALLGPGRTAVGATRPWLRIRVRPRDGSRLTGRAVFSVRSGGRWLAGGRTEPTGLAWARLPRLRADERRLRVRVQTTRHVRGSTASVPTDVYRPADPRVD